MLFLYVVIFLGVQSLPDLPIINEEIQTVTVTAMKKLLDHQEGPDRMTIGTTTTTMTGDRLGDVSMTEMEIKTPESVLETMMI